MVYRISSERKVKRNFGTSKFEYSEGPVGDVLERLEDISNQPHLGVRLERSLDVISGRPQDFRSWRLRDGQIGSLGDVLRISWGPIFAGWDFDNKLKNVSSNKNELNELWKKVKVISIKGFTEDLINKLSILNGAKYFSSRIFQNY